MKSIDTNRAFPATVIPREVKNDLPPGSVLVRIETGEFVLFQSADQQGTLAILVSSPTEGWARVGFAGVFFTEDLQIEGLPLEGWTRLEAQGIHIMSRDGCQPRFASEKTEPKKPKKTKEKHE